MDTIERAIQKLTGKRPQNQPPAAQKSLMERADQQSRWQPEVPPPGQTHGQSAVPTRTPRRNAAAVETAGDTPAPAVGAAYSDESELVISPRMLESGPPKQRLVVPQERIRQHGMIMPDEHRSRIKEEYRLIKRPLLMNAAGKGATLLDFPNLMMVTSSQPGEGKTFTALNLALSIASERDLTVLLVDADVVKPRLSAFFGVAAQTGLVDFLGDDSIALTDVLVATDIPSLTILPAGNTHHLTTELIASRNMRELAEALCRHNPDRIVIFDSPPLLATPEASVLAHLVGQIVMVVEAERTLQSHVREALALLDPDMIVGFVLNKTRKALGSDYYGYGGGYGYYGDGNSY